jgi:hypothetical protein
MNPEELCNRLKSIMLDQLELTVTDGRVIMQLPFTNYKGEPIEIEAITKDDGSIVLDDLGVVAGFLFELNEYTEGALGHLLIRSLADFYGFTMHYDEGIISGQVSATEEVGKLLDFMKVITSVETVLPFISRPHKKKEGRRRLSAVLGKDIAQLHLPLRVEKQAKVEGKHETWDVNYKYVREKDNTDVLILTADLGLSDPKERAAHVVTLASDLLDKEVRASLRRELRVVYSSNGNGSTPTKRAANIIDDYQSRVGYRAFNYADVRDKSLFTNLTIRDLSPMEL